MLRPLFLFLLWLWLLLLIVVAVVAVVPESIEVLFDLPFTNRPSSQTITSFTSTEEVQVESGSRQSRESDSYLRDLQLERDGLKRQLQQAQITNDNLVKERDAAQEKLHDMKADFQHKIAALEEERDRLSLEKKKFESQARKAEQTLKETVRHINQFLSQTQPEANGGCVTGESRVNVPAKKNRKRKRQVEMDDGNDWDIILACGSFNK